MKRFLMLTLILFLVSGVTVTADTEEREWGPNLLRSSPNLTLYLEAANGIPQFVEGDLRAAAPRGNEVSAAIGFFEENRAAYRMTDPKNELVVKRLDEDRLGMQHIRFEQFHRGLRVIGGDLIAHFDTGGRLTRVNGFYQPDIELQTQPDVGMSQATDIAVTDLEGFFGAAQPDEPELVVFPWDDTYYLAWRLFLHSDRPAGRWEYLVDASTGEVLFKANRIMNDEEIGTGVGVMGDTITHLDTWFTGSEYLMIDYTRQANNNIHGHDGQMPDGNYIKTNIAGATLPGSTASDPDNFWDNYYDQASAVSGHTYTCLVYDWLLSALDRNGFDDNGSKMLTIVDYSGDGTNNAYWDGSRIVIWAYSMGWRSLAGCPDVIAHEWGHAVTQYCSDLAYQRESGALNEAFSDIMGSAFEFAHDSMDTPDWNIGENGMISGSGFRSMYSPHLYGDPDFYGTSDPYWIDVVNCTPSPLNDYCGVHTNCGVGNKWFYLLSDGGSHHGVTVTGIGVANAIQVAYRANAYYWTYNSDYHDGAIGTIFAAGDLDSSGVWKDEVAKAWNAVGVSTPAPYLVFDYPSGIPEMIEPASSTTMQVTLSDGWDAVPQPGTGQFHYSIDGGPYTIVPMTEVSANSYEAEIPKVDCDQQIAFYFSAEDLTGARFYDPDTTSPYAPVVATEAIIVMEDDFEADQGWIVYSSATDGQWSRGVPIGGGDRGDPPTDYDGSGQCYLTDNVDGNSDVDDGTTDLESPTFSLEEGNARIFYARWYSNDFGDNPHSDVMNVYVSNDGGGNWTLVETVGPVEEAGGGWYEHSFWVSDFITPTAQMRLRFEVSDLGDGSVVEAGVDAVRIKRYECIAWICGDLNRDEDINLADLTRMIDYVYLEGAPPDPMEAGNVNGSPDGTINLGDITRLTDFIYLDGPDLTCF
jgi:thermolysin